MESKPIIIPNVNKIDKNCINSNKIYIDLLFKYYYIGMEDIDLHPVLKTSNIQNILDTFVFHNKSKQTIDISDLKHLLEYPGNPFKKFDYYKSYYELDNFPFYIKCKKNISYREILKLITKTLYSYVEEKMPEYYDYLVYNTQLVYKIDNIFYDGKFYKVILKNILNTSTN